MRRYLTAVYDPLGNYIPFQAFADPRPPAGSYSSASFGGLSGGLANPQAYGTGCMLDGLPANCNLTSRMQNIGSAAGCPNNDCGPQARRARMQDRSLFSFLTTPYMAFGNSVSGYFLPVWAEAGTPQEQADAIGAWIFGGRTGIDSRRGQTIYNFLPQNSDCGKFVDRLIGHARLNQKSGRVNVGRGLLTMIPTNQKKREKLYPNLPVSGFKNRLIKNQGGWVYAHVTGIAGGTLIGSSPIGLWGQTGNQLVGQQMDEDRRELNEAIEVGKLFTTYDYYGTLRPVEEVIDERRSEVADNEAGQAVGQILGNAINRRSTTTFEEARAEIFSLLCDW